MTSIHNICRVAVGIDLGTTFSVVGFNQNGKVTIISDEFGRNIFPSVVSYLEDGGTNNNVSFNQTSKR